MDNYHNISINIYETGPVDWFPFDAMEQFDEFEKRIEERNIAPWDTKERQQQNLAVVKAMIKACKKYSDEITEGDMPYISILPNGNSIVVFHNVHKGSAIIASTFNINKLFDISNLEIACYYNIAPSEYTLFIPGE